MATPGAGKSYAAKLLALRSLLAGVDVLVLDPEGEYRALCAAAAGQHVRLAAASPQRINPFDLPLPPRARPWSVRTVAGASGRGRCARCRHGEPAGRPRPRRGRPARRAGGRARRAAGDPRRHPGGALDGRRARRSSTRRCTAPTPAPGSRPTPPPGAGRRPCSPTSTPSSRPTPGRRDRRGGGSGGAGRPPAALRRRLALGALRRPDERGARPPPGRLRRGGAGPRAAAGGDPPRRRAGLAGAAPGPAPPAAGGRRGLERPAVPGGGRLPGRPRPAGPQALPGPGHHLPGRAGVPALPARPDRGARGGHQAAAQAGQHGRGRARGGAAARRPRSGASCSARPRARACCSRRARRGRPAGRSRSSPPPPSTRWSPPPPRRWPPAGRPGRPRSGAGSVPSPRKESPVMATAAPEGAAAVPRREIDALKRDRPLAGVLEASGVRLRPGSPGTFWALCPFHAETEPSFFVDVRDPDDQHFHCFGACGAHGDVITFVRLRERVGFAEACARLAGALPRRPRAPRAPRGPRAAPASPAPPARGRAAGGALGPADARAAGADEQRLRPLPGRPLAGAGGPGLPARAGPPRLGDPPVRARLRRRALPGGLPAPPLGAAPGPGAGPAAPAGAGRRRPAAARALRRPDRRPGAARGPGDLVHRAPPRGRRRRTGRTSRRGRAGPGRSTSPCRGSARCWATSGRPGGARCSCARASSTTSARSPGACRPAAPAGTALPAERLGFLAGARAVYGVLDGDAAGRAAAARFAAQLGPRFRPLRLPDGCDLNDLARRPDGRTLFFRLVAAARRAGGAAHDARASSPLGAKEATDAD